VAVAAVTAYRVILRHGNRSTVLRIDAERPQDAATAGIHHWQDRNGGETPADFEVMTWTEANR
jgi:RNA:NAD 2'-phosphotransferase (TPT1/KptA family)